jgi:hypothetical protein
MGRACAGWDEGTSYRMTVDVESVPEGTRLTLTLDGAVKLGFLGRIAIRWLGAPRRLGAILNHYERDLVTVPRVH